MNLKNLLQQVHNGTLSVDDAAKQLNTQSFSELGYANVDHHRNIRSGCPEVIYCAGKNADQVLGIAKNMIDNQSNVLATRVTENLASKLQEAFQDAQWNPAARTVVVKRFPTEKQGNGRILIVTAGTSDIPVAEEAKVTAQFLGNQVRQINDVGVAGLHRLLNKLDDINQANVVIVVAGMDGALPSVVAGLTDKPVIAVPTSIGYGSNFNGLAPLLAMLNSCANGLAVVNIDNGFGAAVIANNINKLTK
jgi:NCAIR mutase (PurE)-related protein